MSKSVHCLKLYKLHILDYATVTTSFEQDCNYGELARTLVGLLTVKLRKAISLSGLSDYVFRCRVVLVRLFASLGQFSALIVPAAACRLNVSRGIRLLACIADSTVAVHC